MWVEQTANGEQQSCGSGYCSARVPGPDLSLVRLRGTSENIGASREQVLPIQCQAPHGQKNCPHMASNRVPGQALHSENLFEFCSPTRQANSRSPGKQSRFSDECPWNISRREGEMEPRSPAQNGVTWEECYFPLPGQRRKTHSQRCVRYTL